LWCASTIWPRTSSTPSSWIRGTSSPTWRWRIRKPPAQSQGYGDGVTLLYKEATATDFILGTNHIQILNECNAIRLDAERIEQHVRTTPEIRECIKDLKVLGMKELRLLKKWRDALRKEFEAAYKEKEGAEAAGAGAAPAEKTPEEVENAELAEVEEQIANLKDEERRAARRKKKRELKEKQKRAMRLNLKMIIPGDEGPTASEEGLFRWLSFCRR
jgi:AdoMet-dependent rRNA methyltransferase SPB1